MTINGLPIPDASAYLAPSTAASSSGPEEQHEPFDGRKRARVEELARQEEDLLREIAELKRRAPSAAATAYAEHFRVAVAADEEAAAAARERATVADNQRLLELEPLDRQSGVEQSFAETVERLGSLKREMPAAVAKMERARVAGEYVVTER